jgi:hypothetical protein
MNLNGMTLKMKKDEKWCRGSLAALAAWCCFVFWSLPSSSG